MWLQFDWWQAEVSEIKPSIWQLYNFCLMIKYEFWRSLGNFKIEAQRSFYLNTWWSRACSINVHYAGRVAQVLEDFTCLLGYRVIWRHRSCVCWRGYPVGVVKSVLIGCYTEWNFNLKCKEISEPTTNLQNLCFKWSDEGTQSTPWHPVHKYVWRSLGPTMVNSCSCPYDTPFTSTQATMEFMTCSCTFPNKHALVLDRVHEWQQPSLFSLSRDNRESVRAVFGTHSRYYQKLSVAWQKELMSFEHFKQIFTKAK